MANEAARNSLTHGGDVGSFSTVSELLALPYVRGVLERPEITDLIVGSNSRGTHYLMAHDRTGPKIVLLGTLKERVMWPKQVERSCRVTV